jgi:hypothetical protein
MTCKTCSNTIEKYGAEPVNIQWKVVRGNTAVLNIDFLEADESTEWDTTGWTYKATSYDPQGNVLDSLPIEATTGSITLTVPSSTTDKWGTSYASVVAELQFDVRVTIPDQEVSGSSPCDIVWTPVIGTICVLGNVTPGGSL